MNDLFHILFNYLMIDVIFGNASSYILPIILASTLIDLDHIPHILKSGKKILKKGLGEKSRSFLHELIGLIIITCISAVAYFIVADKMLVKIIYACLLAHLVLDFLTGKSRIFYPFSKRVFISPLQKTQKTKIIFEIIATIIIIGVFIKWTY